MIYPLVDYIDSFPKANVRLFTYYFLQKYEEILNNVRELLKI